MSPFPQGLSLALSPPNADLPKAPGGLEAVAEWRPPQGVSPGARRFAEDIRAAGGVALIVGGWVRDGLLGYAPKDEDIEVFGLSPEAVAKAASRRSVPVGSGFGILKVGPLDVSFPRRTRATGVGPKGWQGDVDLKASLKDAAFRRDLTLNALAWEPLSGALFDPFGGLEDLAARRLRWVDPGTFIEDPIRVLRVIQLMARLEATLDPALEARLPALVGALLESPRERIWTEIEGLLMKGRSFGPAFALAQRIGLLAALMPPLVDLDDGQWAALNRSLAHRRSTQNASPFDERVVALALLLCPLPEAERLPLLEALTQEKRLLILSPKLAGLTPELGRLSQALSRGEDVTFPLRSLAREVSIPLALRIYQCRHTGLHGDYDPQVEGLLLAADAAGVKDGPLPALINGRDLTKGGVPPGPELGRLLEAVYQAQLQGLVTTRAQAIALALTLTP